MRRGIMKHSKWAGRMLLSLVAMMCVVADSRAPQTTESIRGKMIDASGGVVKNVPLTPTEVDTGFSRKVTSDSVGDFVFVELPVGTYRLEAEAKDFQKFAQEGITLHVNQTASVTVQLAAQGFRDKESADSIDFADMGRSDAAPL